MSEFKVASRYAKSLIDLAQEENATEAVYQDMVQIVAVMKANAELRAVLANPIIKQDKKQQIISRIFGGKIQKSIEAFFEIMIRKGRAGLVYSTAQEFLQAYKRLMNIVEAKVISAAALSQEHMERIKEAIAAQTGGTVVLNNQIKPELIGGFIITVGDKQLDSSILGKLNKLEKYLEA